MGKFKKEDIKYEMIEFLGSIKENSNSDWSKSVAKIAWNNNPSTIDIRNMNLSQDIMGKGISLTDEEVDNLVDLLLFSCFICCISEKNVVLLIIMNIFYIRTCLACQKMPRREYILSSRGIKIERK